MTVAVIGAGVAGLSTAYALHRDGHEVVVIDRNDGPGAGTSFANAGGLCPSFAGPWAGPGMVRKALGWLLQPAAPLKIRPRADRRQWAWLLRFAQECDAGRAAENKRVMQRLAHYSHACLADILAETGIDCAHARGGILQAFRSAETLAAGRRASAVLEELGIAHRMLGPEEIAQVEPALVRADARFTGALHFPGDGTGDAHLYCRGMAAWLEAGGVRFRYGAAVRGLATRGGRLTGLRLAGETLAVDAAVLASGPHAAELAPEVPVYPVKGYSLTFDGLAEGAGPRSSVMDEDSKVMFTRLGDRLRVGGVAELAGFDRTMRRAQLDAMAGLAARLFPETADAAPREWCGFRPMTPDGRPRIGASARVPGLWLNLGGGSNGWTQAAGAGRLVADLVGGRAPEVDPAPYAPAA